MTATCVKPRLQLEAPIHPGCGTIFTECTFAAAQDEQPELRRVLEDVLRSGDILVVWKLDRLARSLTKLSTAEDEGAGEAKLDHKSSRRSDFRELTAPEASLRTVQVLPPFSIVAS